MGAASQAPRYLRAEVAGVVLEFLQGLWPLPRDEGHLDAHVPAPNDWHYLPAASFASLDLRRHALLWADALHRLVLLGHALPEVAEDTARSLNLDLPQLVSLAASRASTGEQAAGDAHALRVEELVRRDAQVVLDVSDGHSMHVQQLLPAVLYLAFVYGASPRTAATALTVSASIPGQSAVRTGLLGVMLAAAHGLACLPLATRRLLNEEVWWRRQRQAAGELAELQRRSPAARARARERCEDAIARARGACSLRREKLEARMKQREEELTDPDPARAEQAALRGPDAALYVTATVAQVLEMERLAHKGRVEAVEAQARASEAAAAAALARELRELDGRIEDLQAAVAAGSGGEQANVEGNPTDDYLVLSIHACVHACVCVCARARATHTHTYTHTHTC